MAESSFSESSWRSTLKWLKSGATSSWHGIATDLYNSINWGCITEKGFKEKMLEQKNKLSASTYEVLISYQALFFVL